MTTRIQLRRGIATDWANANPTLALGEAGIETNTLQWKVGDGTTAWLDLPYMSGGAGTGNIGFSGDAIYDINGIFLENADLSHGATAAIILPSNGSTSAIQVNNIYGNIALQSGTTGNVTASWLFDNTGNLILPGNTFGVNYANGTPVNIGGGGNYGNANLANIGSNNISTTGNISANVLLGNLITAPDGNTSILVNVGGFIGAPAGFSYDYNANTQYVETVNISGRNNRGENAIYGGVAGFTPLGSNVVAQLAGNATTYTQINFQNISADPQASGDYIITANNGTDTENFIDMGIASNTWDGTQNNSLGTSVRPNDGYLYVNGANLVLGTTVNGGNTYTWQFGSTGTLTFPENSGAGWPVKQQRYGMGNIGAWLDGEWTIGEFSGNSVMGQVGIRIDPGIEGSTGMTFPGSLNSNTNPVSIYSTNGGGIQLFSGNSAYWTFDSTGALNLPAASGPGSLNGFVQTANAYPTVLAYGSGGHGGPELDWMNADNPANTFGNVNTLRHTMYLNGGGLFVGLNENETPGHVIGNLRFDTNANLTVSGNIITEGAGGDITMSGGNITGADNIVLANSISTTGAGGNLTLTGGSINGVNSIGGLGNLILVPNANSASAFLDVYLTVGPDIHIAGNGENVIIGRDSGSNVTVGADGSVTIRGDNGTAHNWIFDNSGNLSIPGSISQGNYNSPNVITATASDPNWAYGFYSNGSTDFYTQAKFYGDTSTTRGFRIVDTTANTVPFMVDGTGNLNVLGNSYITTANGVGGAGGKSINITASASDTVTWNSNPGGDINITGGYGSFGDGGGGPGGNVNISAGLSSDSSTGNVNITAGGKTYSFNNSGELFTSSRLYLNSSSMSKLMFNNLDVGAQTGDSLDTTFSSQYGRALVQASTVNGSQFQWNFRQNGVLTADTSAVQFNTNEVEYTAALQNSSSSGNGGRAMVHIANNGTAALVQVAAGGTGYAVNDTLYIVGDTFYNGVATLNDLQFIVTSVDGGGAITGLTLTGGITPAQGIAFNPGGLHNGAVITDLSSAAGSTGNLTVQVYDSIGNVYLNSTFDNTGNLTVAKNIISKTTVTSPVAYANLTAVAGGRAFVNNANLVAAGNFGAQISGGGSNTVPVWSDGVNWYIG